MNTDKPLFLDKLHVLDMCAQVEDKNAELYYLFATNFSSHPEHYKFWMRIANEEESHANEIRLASRLKDDCFLDVSVDVSKAISMLQFLSQIISSVKGSPPDQESALRGAIKLEEKLAIFHIECVAVFKDPKLTKLFAIMNSTDKQHLLALKSAYEELTSN